MDKDYDGEVDGHGGGGGGSSDSSDGQGRSGDSCCGASGGSSTVHESGSSGEFSSFYQGINNHSTVWTRPDDSERGFHRLYQPLRFN